MAQKTEITRAELLTPAEFEGIRSDRRAEIVALKKRRRLQVGPHATCNFECYETMCWQIHEMLRIEKGGDEQIADELVAYNPLVPNGNELVCTVMFEIVEPPLRQTVLATLGGVEEAMFLNLGSETIQGVSEADLNRTTASGKASSVQFIHFPFTAEQVAWFRTSGAEAIVGFNHPSYGHMAAMPEDTREALAADLA
ncbi:MAG: DUF3501 family protein [Alphaproteobacteria bacterium]|nr:DUF3501 family protein [Alphaproteobacteria bacterium]